MIDLNMNRYRLLLLFVIPLIFIACNDNDNNDSLESVIYGEKTIPEDHLKPSSSDDKKPTINLDDLPQSKLMITASQTNAWNKTYEKFDLGLTDIIFTVIPDGFEQEFKVPLSKTSHSNIDHVIPLDLTYLHNDQHLLLPTANIPAGKITSITLCFSGEHSVIEMPHPSHKGSKLETYFVDAFYSSYTPGDSRTRGDQRRNPAQLTTKIDLPMTEGEFQYINIDIDKNMSVGIDPYSFIEKTGKTTTSYQYIQFIPIASITMLEKGTEIALLNISKQPSSISSEPLNTETLAVNTKTQTMSRSTDGDKSYAYMTAILSTDNTPVLLSPFVDFLDVKDIIDDYEHNKKKHAKVESDKAFLHFRDTVNPDVQVPSIALGHDQIKSEDKTQVVISLPAETHQLSKEDKAKGGRSEINKMEWTVQNIITYANPADMKNPKDPVNNLIFRLNNKDRRANRYTLIETRRGDIHTFTEAPDEITTFDNFGEFYFSLKFKTENQKARILMLNISGHLTKSSDFLAGEHIKVILSSQLFDDQVNFLIMSFVEKIINKISEILGYKP